MDNFLKIENNSMLRGVLPVPPRYIFPTHITGIWKLFFFDNIFFKKNNNFKHKAIGKSRIAKNETLLESQNLGFSKIIFNYLYILLFLSEHY